MLRIGLPTITQKDVKKWGWVAYPVAVVVVVVFGTTVIFGGGLGVWERLRDQSQKVNEMRMKVQGLNTKLDELSRENTGKLRGDLEWLVTVVPTTARAWVVVGEMRKAAEAEGATLTDWQANGSGLTGTFNVASAEVWLSVVKNLEKMLPLVTIKSTNYALGRATVNVEGAGVELGSAQWTGRVSGLVDGLRLKLKEYEASTGRNEDAQQKVIVGPGGNPFE